MSSKQPVEPWPATREDALWYFEAAVVRDLERLYRDRKPYDSLKLEMLADHDIHRALEILAPMLPLDLQTAVERALAVYALLSTPERYYIRRSDDTEPFTFVLSERETPDGELFSESHRRIGSDFTDYAAVVAVEQALNKAQRALDLDHGFWVKRAADEQEREHNL